MSLGGTLGASVAGKGRETDLQISLEDHKKCSRKNKKQGAAYSSSGFLAKSMQTAL